MRSPLNEKASAERALRRSASVREDTTGAPRSNVAALLVFVEPARVLRCMSLLEHGGASAVMGPFFGHADMAEAARRPFTLTAASTPDAEAPKRERYALGHVTIDVAAYEVVRAGTPIALSALEFDLLVALARALGAIVPAPTLQRMIPSSAAGPDSHSLRAHVANLRRKLEDDTRRPRCLITVRRRGYRLAGVRRLD